MALENAQHVFIGAPETVEVYTELTKDVMEEVGYKIRYPEDRVDRTVVLEEEVLYRWLGSPMRGDRIEFNKDNLRCVGIFYSTHIYGSHEKPDRRIFLNSVQGLTGPNEGFFPEEMKNMRTCSTNPDVNDIGYFDPVTFERIN